MIHFKRAFWGALLLLSLLWAFAETSVFQASGLMAWRDPMIQYTGILAIGCMSGAMILALRPRWPERWLGGLDKMYRLHKWLGIGALCLSVLHWVWSQGPKWAIGLGLIQRPTRGARVPVEDPIQAFFLSLRGPAEGLGEWAFYISIGLIALALITFFPYRLFFKTHRILALTYLVLAFHTVVLMKFSYWATPVGWATGAMLLAGIWAAIIVLLRRVGASRKVRGRIVALEYYPGVRSLETEIEIPTGWPGHQPGQFAFATSNPSEGAHPYTIASHWNPDSPRIRFITKELGDHTATLRQTLAVGKDVTVEGPYGCFTFDDDRPNQIWIGGGIGITPFIARMKHLASDATVSGIRIDLFHTTAEVDETALTKLTEDARNASIGMHVLIDARDGRLNGQRIRDTVPNWREASIWFCGPAGFGEAIRKDFAAQGFPVARHFHQELFDMR